jgi:hypothetical protein
MVERAPDYSLFPIPHALRQGGSVGGWGLCRGKPPFPRSPSPRAFRRPGPRGMVDRWVADRASLCSQLVDPGCLDRNVLWVREWVERAPAHCPLIRLDGG